MIGRGLRWCWHTCGDNGSGFWCWALPLIFFFAVVGADWLRLHHEGVATRGESVRLLRHVGFAAYLAAAFILAFTRRWTLQQLGLLALLIGGAELKVRLIAHWGPQPVPEWERDVTQALFDIGTAAIIVALAWYGAMRAYRWRCGEPSPEEV